ncbi:MAG: helix-turn-helix domain-containing protein, partial [Planctomycetota bacterium]
IARGYHIPTDGTAGDWVREYGCPLIGRDPDEMRPYPRTHEYLERENFASNLLVPIELGSFGKGVVFLLSRSPASFTQDNIAVALRVRDVLEPALRAHLAAIELLEGREATEPDPTAPPGVLQPSLNDVERRHIEATLIRTNWIIEGPRGAARILGIRPSTLRHRLRRLGIRRPS